MNLAVTSGNEEERIANLFKRKGVLLKPRRYSGTIRQDIENFDAVWYIGNSHNYHSYDCFKMPPVYYIKIMGIHLIGRIPLLNEILRSLSFWKLRRRS